jgi:short-subunit dehydrogenase
MSFNPKIKRQDWCGKNVWLIGASTGIGEAFARQIAGLGARVLLSARGVEKLQKLADQLPNSTAIPLDFTNVGAVQAAWTLVSAACDRGMPDMVLINAGSYEAMLAKEFDLMRAKQQFDVNVNGPLNVLSQVLPAFTRAGRGHIALVSSVAGYSALPKAMVYGASKSALTYMAHSLYLELVTHGDQGAMGVTVICPGFVKTPLTAGNDFYMPAIISAQKASQAMLDGFARGEFEIHFPKRFTLFLKVLGWLPRPWYFKLMRRLL